MLATKTPDFNETVSLQQYRGAIDFLESHIQLIDASLSYVNGHINIRKDKDEKIFSAFGVEEKNYRKLNHPIKQLGTLLNASQKRTIEYSIVQLYNYFSNYLKSILGEMYKKDPFLVVSKAVHAKTGEEIKSFTFTYAELIKLGNFEDIKEKMISRIFRSLEELKSTSQLLEKILAKTKVVIPDDIKNQGLMYLEIRHLIIHSQNIIDEDYEKRYGVNFTPDLKSGDKIPLNYILFKDGISAISNLVSAIDLELIRHGLVEKRKFNSPSATPNFA